MKPVLLDPVHIPTPDFVEQIRQSRLSDSGRPDTDEINQDLWDPSLFFEHLRKHGYRQRECNHYESLSLTFLNGSCCWHTDPGYGLVACWLIYSENHWDYEAELITKSGPVPMREFNLCVFDADQGHAWISNGVCVMVTATVSKIRQKKQQPSSAAHV